MTRRKFSLLAFVLAALAAQTGCGASARYAPSSVPAQSKVSAEAQPADAVPALAAAAPSVETSAPAAPGAPSAPARSAGPKSSTTTPPARGEAKNAKNAGPSVRAPVIIYHGDLKMLADEDAIPKTIDRVIDVAEELGGHLAGRKDTSVQIKVPSASFREALTKIEQIGGVASRSVSADDVSEEFHDLEVRLANLRATRQRLQEFMAKANAVNDMLTVERELERVAGEIDRITGRLEFLRTRAAMSIIAVELRAKPKAAPIVKREPPPPARTANLPIPWVQTIGIDPLLTLGK
jgi:hypothetical protein